TFSHGRVFHGRRSTEPVAADHVASAIRQELNQRGIHGTTDQDDTTLAFAIHAAGKLRPPIPDVLSHWRSGGSHSGPSITRRTAASARTCSASSRDRHSTASRHSAKAREQRLLTVSSKIT